MFDQCQIRKKIKNGISLKEMSMTFISEHELRDNNYYNKHYYELLY